MSDNEIAVGVPMFQREAALAQLLESVPSYVSTVYIADNGEAESRKCYRRDWPFELDVEQLPYDCGIGLCRANIVNRCTEAYLWAGDNDMEIVHDDDLRRMRSLLEAEPHLGGVSAWLIEGDTVRSGAKDLVEHGETLIKTVNGRPEIQHSVLPYSTFDYLPQCGLFRRAALESYSWDANLRHHEHLDFFVGHKHGSTWVWASTPAIQVMHHKQISAEYREEKNAKDATDWDEFSGKWGYDEQHSGERADWTLTRPETTAERAFNVIRDVAPRSVWVPLRSFAMRRGWG